MRLHLLFLRFGYQQERRGSFVAIASQDDIVGVDAYNEARADVGIRPYKAQGEALGERIPPLAFARSE